MVTCLKGNIYSLSYFDNRNWPMFYLEYYGLNKVKMEEKMESKQYFSFGAFLTKSRFSGCHSIILWHIVDDY